MLVFLPYLQRTGGHRRLGLLKILITGRLDDGTVPSCRRDFDLARHVHDVQVSDESNNENVGEGSDLGGEEPAGSVGVGC